MFQQDFWILIIIIIATGVFGGFVNFLQTRTHQNYGRRYFLKCAVPGIAASFLVPLFLRMISSDLIKNSKDNDRDVLVLVGFCLIAAIFSKRFIDTIGEKVLKAAEEAKQEAEEAKEIAQNTNTAVDLITAGTTEPAETTVIAEERLVTDIAENDLSNIKDFSGHSMATPKIQSTIKSVFNALKDSRYTFRTLKGISKEANIDEIQCEAILDVFGKKGWCHKLWNTSDNRFLYALTKAGRKINLGPTSS